MAIAFDKNRWTRIKNDCRKWWAGKLERPLIHATVRGRDAGRPAPTLPGHGFTAFYDDSVSAEQIVDLWDYELSRITYLGDAFPSIWPNFGAGVLAVMLGGRAECAPEAQTVWFHPVVEKELADLSFKFNPDTPWFRRICDICKAAEDRWDGLVQVSMTDLGGNLDILSTFRPAEKLLMDLYDCPDEVKRLTWEAHEAWWQAFEAINAILQPRNPGYTAWAANFSEDPYYMLQCDFCYMLSPAMFDEFVKPELAATCKRLTNPFYHLDGPGQLPHLDSLLDIQKLKGIQWIPGAGRPSQAHWPEVYRRIRDGGKLIELASGLETLDAVADQLGSARGIVLRHAQFKTEKDAVAALERYGVEP